MKLTDEELSLVLSEQAGPGLGKGGYWISGRACLFEAAYNLYGGQEFPIWAHNQGHLGWFDQQGYNLTVVGLLRGLEERGLA